jgi:hypothetical protein
MPITNDLLINSLVDLEPLTEESEEIRNLEEAELRLEDTGMFVPGNRDLMRHDRIRNLRTQMELSALRLAGFLIQWINRSLSQNEIQDESVISFLHAQHDKLIDLIIVANKQLAIAELAELNDDLN